HIHTCNTCKKAVIDNVLKNLLAIQDMVQFLSQSLQEKRLSVQLLYFSFVCFIQRLFSGYGSFKPIFERPIEPRSGSYRSAKPLSVMISFRITSVLRTAI